MEDNKQNIDLSPILAERDRMKAENEKLLEEGSKMACGQCIVDGALIGDERGNLYCTVLAERDRMRAALEELVKINSDVPAFPNEIFEDRIDCAWHEARAALEGKS